MSGFPAAKRIKSEIYAEETTVPTIKQEVGEPLVDPSKVEEMILKLCEGQRDGVNDTVIQLALPNINAQGRVEALNKLLAKGQVEILKQGGKLIYRYVDQDKTKGCEKDERTVYQVIERASTKGIWVRDIRVFSGLALPQLNKILKSLENKKLIKAVKSVSAAKKKLYMLFDLEPDRSITGGAWYSGQEFESEFVEVLQQQCYRFLLHKAKTAAEKYQDDTVNTKNNSAATSEDVWSFIKQLGISKVQLDVVDIEVILSTLCYQGKAIKSVSSEKVKDTDRYMKLWAARDASSYETMPICRIACGKCPVRHDCSTSGVRNPIACEYTRDFLTEIEDMERNPQEEPDPYAPISDSLLDY